MKNLIPLIIGASLIVSGCISYPSANSRSHSREAQHARADRAFDELDGRQTSPAPTHNTAKAPESMAAPATAAPSATVPPPKNVSEASHLMARGYGESRPEAIRRAKAELSNIFESRIESDISSITRAVTDSNGEDALYKNVQSKIRVASSVTLEGVEVGPVTKEKREYTATVGLNRARAAQKWQHEMAKITARIHVEEQAATASAGKLMALRHLNAAMDLFIEREALVSRLRVIGYPVDGSGHKAFEAIVARVQATKTNFRIAIKHQTTRSDALAQNLAEELTQAGFLVGSTPTASDATLRISLTLSKVKNNNPDFKFMRAMADVAIIDPTTGKTVGHLTENQRGAHLTYEEAGVKAVGKLSGKLSKKIVAYFN